MNHLLTPALLFTAVLSLAAAPPDDFTVKSATSRDSFRLQDAHGKFVALHFLLKTECPLCLRHTREHLARAATLPDLVQVFLKPDTDREIAAWAARLTDGKPDSTPIYRDPSARLAKTYGIPDGYAFHGQLVHYPATVLIGPDGREVFRHVGKSNADRLSFEKLAEKVAELRKP
jgi:peroxiredoxin Q/BCP